MKKVISLVLSVVLFFGFCFVCNAADVFDNTKILMGDLNYDGKINSKDAKIILRVAAKLEPNNFNQLLFDTDGNGKLSVSDAKVILRYSAKLGVLSTGFDKNGVPNIINALKSGNYSMSFSDEGFDFEIVMAQNDLLMTLPDALFNEQSLGMSSEMMVTILGLYPTGILFKGDASYFVGKDSENKPTALELTDIIKSFDDFDFSEWRTIVSFGKYYSQFTDFNERNIIVDSQGKNLLEYKALLENTDKGQRYVSMVFDEMGNLCQISEGYGNVVYIVYNISSCKGNVDLKRLSLSYYE